MSSRDHCLCIGCSYYSVVSVQEHLIDPPQPRGRNSPRRVPGFLPRFFLCANGNRMEFQRHCCKDNDVNCAALSVERAFIGAFRVFCIAVRGRVESDGVGFTADAPHRSFARPIASTVRGVPSDGASHPPGQGRRRRRNLTLLPTTYYRDPLTRSASVRPFVRLSVSQNKTMTAAWKISPSCSRM